MDPFPLPAIIAIDNFVNGLKYGPLFYNPFSLLVCAIQVHLTLISMFSVTSAKGNWL